MKCQNCLQLKNTNNLCWLKRIKDLKPLIFIHIKKINLMGNFKMEAMQLYQNIRPQEIIIRKLLLQMMLKIKYPNQPPCLPIQNLLKKMILELIKYKEESLLHKMSAKETHLYNGKNFPAQLGKQHLQICIKTLQI